MKIQVYQGYAWLKGNGHPRSNSGKVKRSVLVLEKKLGRSLRPGEMVHHIDGNRLNDDPTNLEITTRSLHMSQHRPIDIKWQKRKRYFAERKRLAIGLWAQGLNTNEIIKIMRVSHRNLRKYLANVENPPSKKHRRRDYSKKTSPPHPQR